MEEARQQGQQQQQQQSNSFVPMGGWGAAARAATYNRGARALASVLHCERRERVLGSVVMNGFACQH